MAHQFPLDIQMIMTKAFASISVGSQMILLLWRWIARTHISSLVECYLQIPFSIF
jgi:hypothetical protein